MIKSGQGNKMDNLKRPKPVDSFTIEKVNLDFIKTTAEKINGKTAFGNYSKSDVVNYSLTLIRHSPSLTSRLEKLIEETEMKRAVKMVKKWGVSYLKRMRRSKKFKEQVVQRINEEK
jgi:hypothetical protein